MAKNLVCCKEEDIEFNFDSDDVKDGGTSADDCVYYPEDGIVEFCADSILTEDSDNNRDFTAIDHSEEDNDKSSDDQTSIFATDIIIENLQLEKLENFAKELPALTEIYGEHLITIIEDEEDSENMSTNTNGCSDDSGDSEDDLTSEECCDDSTDALSSEDDSSDDTSTSEDATEYYDKPATTKGRTKSRPNFEESAASDLTDYAEEERLLRTELREELDGSYSKAFKGCVAVYVVAMFLYFYINDAITYAKKNNISPSFHEDDVSSEFIKQLTILYAETLDDQITLEFVRGYTGRSNFPISNLSTENAWVVLALADAHQDEELVKTVMDFLNANKAKTLESLAWRNEVGSKILKAHAVFRQSFATKPPMERLEV